MPIRPTLCAAAVAGLTLVAPLSAGAAPGDWVAGVKPIAPPAEGQGRPLPVAAAPGAPSAGPAPREGWAIDRGQRLAYDVTEPQLIAVGGNVCRANCPAVILVPGGGFEFLAMDNEGFQVARWLQPLGVKVFILKYRTLPLPDGFAGFQAAIAATFAGKAYPGGRPKIEADLPDAVADAQAALRAVRAHAGELGVDPARIGLVGFSAGAITALRAVQADAAGARPDFLGLIYGPTAAGPIPPHAPPLFAALAADDRFFGKDDLGLITGWRRSGASVELHLFSGGGHGFASQPNGTTSDGWFDEFVRWLRATKVIAPA
jgi:acetyl esterase/lipase